MSSTAMDYYRADGVRITHDPYTEEMMEKYGVPGKTDSEGFDPYADSVGPGIYGGIVKRDKGGQVVIGRQYQNHNPRPGPVYAGGGYTPINNALRKGVQALKPLLDVHPDLVNDVSTGGASPLHMCGMSRQNQLSTEYLIRRGGNIESLDTYGMTPLHRMASNNLAVGAEALLKFGADPAFTGQCGQTPLDIARGSRANDVIQVLRSAKHKQHPQQLQVTGASSALGVNGLYTQKHPQVVPLGFSLTCAAQSPRWDPEEMWLKLSDQKTPWFEAKNGAYIYWNRGDGQWWVDASDGRGVFVAKAGPAALVKGGRLAVKGGGLAWKSLVGQTEPLPTVSIVANTPANST